ncbi:hypothetical protein AB1N83_008518 [Pleurotus pulmonarius]
MSQGNVRNVVINASASPFNSTIYTVKDIGGAKAALGSVAAGATVTFAIDGLDDGEDFRISVEASTGNSNTATTKLTYIGNAAFEAVFNVTGNGNNPHIAWQFPLLNNAYGHVWKLEPRNEQEFHWHGHHDGRKNYIAGTALHTQIRSLTVPFKCLDMPRQLHPTFMLTLGSALYRSRSVGCQQTLLTVCNHNSPKVLMSQGNVRRFVINSRAAVFDCTVYAMKDNIISLKVGTVPAGKYIAFALNNIEGLSNGDEIQAKITSNQGFPNTDSNVVTFVGSATMLARYAVSGTATNPNISLEAIEKIVS